MIKFMLVHSHLDDTKNIEETLRSMRMKIPHCHVAGDEGSARRGSSPDKQHLLHRLHHPDQAAETLSVPSPL